MWPSMFSDWAISISSPTPVVSRRRNAESTANAPAAPRATTRSRPESERPPAAEAIAKNDPGAAVLRIVPNLGSSGALRALEAGAVYARAEGLTDARVRALPSPLSPYNWVVITQQPASVTVDVGGNASFTVAAISSGTLAYQWRKDGVAIAGKTNADLAITGDAEATLPALIEEVKRALTADRRRAIQERGRKVTWLELFFDLVFVAAVSQVAAPLHHDYSLDGLLRLVPLFALIWWAWTGHSVFSTRFDTDDGLQRGLTLLQMFAVAVMAANAKDGLDSRSSAGFAAAYVCCSCKSN